MRNKTILIIAAHPDDVEFGMGGTTAKLSKHNKVSQLILCKGDRPGNEHVQQDRQRTVHNNAQDLGVTDTQILNYSDVKLDRVSFIDLTATISDHIERVQPEVVYTNHEYDIHNDHKVTSQAVKVVTRPRKSLPVNLSGPNIA